MKAASAVVRTGQGNYSSEILSLADIPMDNKHSDSGDKHSQGTCKCSICTRLPIDLGSLTQWLLRAELSQTSEQQLEPDFCSECGLRKQPEMPGSLTQWIFKFHTCSCERKQLSYPGKNSPAGLDLLQDRQDGGLSSHDCVPRLEFSSSSTATGNAAIDGPQGFPLERFEPLSEIATGSSGKVLKASDRILNKTVAIKLIHTNDEQQLVDFQNEAKAISLLSHQNIVRVLDFSVSKSGTPYMVMEFVEGQSLESYLETNGHLPVDQSVEIVLQIAEAVSHAHARGVLHRDLKPGNILLERSDDKLKAKVVDFGLARIKRETLVPTDTGDRLIVGTPTYMSPDTVRGLKFDQRSDIYSLGTILFECIAGRPPFEANSPLELIAMKASQEPPSIKDMVESDDVSSLHEQLLSKAIARDASDRHQTMKELVVELKEIHHPESIKNTGEYSGEDSGTTAAERTDTISKKETVRLMPRLVALASMMALAMVVVLFCCMSVFDRPMGSNLSEIKEIYSASDPIEQIDGIKSFVAIPIKPHPFLLHRGSSSTGLQLGELSNLKVIRGLAIRKRTLTAGEMRQLRKEGLRTLVLQECQLNDAAIKEIGSLRLHGLYLCGSNLRGRSISALGQIKNLVRMDLSSTGVSANQLQVLRRFRHLSYLNLSKNNIGDQSASQIAKLPALRTLVISDTRFSARGLLTLRSAGMLKNVYAARCTAIGKRAPRLHPLILHRRDYDLDNVTNALSWL